ncbi:4Fe-4S ferredoxin [Pelomyxa schiedti]|nr:4Fe-4S ferredoxin [Pelomyxa schiedti]
MGQTYHAKTMTHEDAKAFITYKGEIRHDLGEKIIPYEIARTLVLKGPTKVGVIQCPCRASKEHGCTPMDVCMVLGSFVDPTAKLKPLRYLTTQEAVELLEAEHKRGHVHTVWFKDIFDGRAFALCNCCKCCCGGIEIMMKYDAHNMISSGYVASRSDITNTAETASPSQAAGCVGCGMCARSCPFNAITLSPGKGAIVDQSKCLGCGVCVEKCPKKCLKLQRDPTKPPPLALNELF